jgi:hypothetical protein
MHEETDPNRERRPPELGHLQLTSRTYLSLAANMQVTWRFFVGDDTRWRWQQLSTDRSVVAESQTSYDDYECCVAAARAQGYVYHAAQGRLVRPGNEGRFSRR